MAVRFKEQADGHPANVNLEPKKYRMQICPLISSDSTDGIQKNSGRTRNSDATDHCMMH